ncbi:hypothetical protein ABZ135_18595 [Streptomyces sp. NPDC006339]|uniref:hypothetical protein n=1 Tax=Streptomyces sp. NPDC006339 TaxID=3156755 RepID=UPI0033AEC5EC
MSARERLLGALRGSPELRPGQAGALVAEALGEVLLSFAGETLASCPDHGDADETWLTCHCDVAQELTAKAALYQGNASLITDHYGEQAATTTPTALRWDRLVMPPDGQDPHTIVCCTDAETGRPAALFLDPVERTRLALRLADPGDASGEAARREFLRQQITAQGGRWKSSRVRRLYAEHGYQAPVSRTARNDLAALHKEGLLDLHDEPGVRYYTPRGDR